MKPYYEEAGVTIYHGDALELLPSLAAVSLIVTDPPYIIGAVSAGSLSSKSGTWGDMMNSATWFAAWYKECARALKYDGAMWTFLNWRTIPVVMRAAMTAQLPIASMMVWDKEWIGPGGPQGLRPSYEMVALLPNAGFCVPDRSLSDVWRHKVGSYKASGHPAEKPVDLVQRIISASAVSGTVVDPFLGSGTTAVAAKALGLPCVGIEAEERYCEIAARRLSQHVLDLGTA